MKRFYVVMMLSLILVAGWCPAARAHERRQVGPFEFVVGFIHEPAFSGGMNGVDLRVTRGGQPVERLEGTLKVTVSRSDTARNKPLEFQPRYKDPGRYAAYFLPTLPGTYVFHITGEINRVKIDEVFKSGSKFHDVTDAESLKFP